MHAKYVTRLTRNRKDKSHWRTERRNRLLKLTYLNLLFFSNRVPILCSDSNFPVNVKSSSCPIMMPSVYPETGYMDACLTGCECSLTFSYILLIVKGVPKWGWYLNPKWENKKWTHLQNLAHSTNWRERINFSSKCLGWVQNWSNHICQWQGGTNSIDKSWIWAFLPQLILFLFPKATMMWRFFLMNSMSWGLMGSRDDYLRIEHNKKHNFPWFWCIKEKKRI